MNRGCSTCKKFREDKWCIECNYEARQTTAKKVIGGGENDGTTCWFECSHCHGTVDLQDMFCKHCGAVLEYERGQKNERLYQARRRP